MDRYAHMPTREVPDEPFVSGHRHLWADVPARSRLECMLCEATAPLPSARHSSCNHEWVETPNRIWFCAKCGAQEQR